MQTLHGELKNIPTSASQACSSISHELNKEETLSVHDKVLTCNNLEVNQLQQTGGLKVNVFVLNIDGNPLMPCSCAKARHLLKGGKAHVVKRFPFTIKLNFECENQVQEVNLGIDTGSRNIGFSAVTDKKELISGTLILDQKTKERLDDRRMYRKCKRNKLRYRKPRFNNRKKKEGWLPPSIDRKYQTHLRLIDKIKSLLPISKVIVEVAKFDIQKIENPDIQGVEYQQGNLYEYQNKVSFLQTRQNNKCIYCNKEFKGESKVIHHIYRHGDLRRTDRVEGLILLHKKCHIDLHERHREKEFEKPVKHYKDATFMSIIHKKFYKDVIDMKVTYGYITQTKRNEYNIEKTHNNDAFIIAGGRYQEICKVITIEQKHRNNRKLQIQKNGYKPSIRRKRYPIQPKDLFWVGDKMYKSKGMLSYGKQVLCNDNKNKKCINTTKITKIYNFGSFVWNYNK